MLQNGQAGFCTIGCQADPVMHSILCYPKCTVLLRIGTTHNQRLHRLMEKALLGQARQQTCGGCQQWELLQAESQAC